MSIKAALVAIVEALRTADALVAADAERQGISKEEAWAGVRAAAQIQSDQAIEWLLDLADPLGWRAAARAMEREGVVRDA